MPNFYAVPNGFGRAWDEEDRSRAGKSIFLKNVDLSWFLAINYH